jgi:hypothetical protein
MLFSPDGEIPTSRGKQSALNLSATFDANLELEEGHRLLIFEEKPFGMSPRVIPAHFRLIRLLVAKTEQNLSDIELLLGCPLLLPNVPRK